MASAAARTGYQAIMTADHTHDRDDGAHGHSHAHGYGHTHRSGFLGRLQHMFIHSHDVHEKVDAALEDNERGMWATKWALIALGSTTIIQLVILYFSGSTALFADTIHNLGDAVNSIPLLIAFALQRRARSRRFTYGFGRVEDLAGVVIVISIAVSVVVAGFESIRKLINPVDIEHIWWVAAAAVIGFLGNEAVALLQIRTGREIGSAALVADGQHARTDGFTSLAVLGAVVGTLIGVPIIDPIIGLLITITIAIILKNASIAIFRRLLDGIEPGILQEIEHAPLHVAGVQDVHQVRARWLGHKVHTDLHVTVDRRLSVADSHAIVQQIEQALASQIPAFGGATIHICPCSHPEPNGQRAEAVA
jgi:cation diffusion facilitator family transporter